MDGWMDGWMGWLEYAHSFLPNQGAFWVRIVCFGSLF